ncbi:MAG: HNH endonuclease [Ruminococcus sp.]|nr:HNH endonuclease [Ruminococcus sp.]
MIEATVGKAKDIVTIAEVNKRLSSLGETPVHGEFYEYESGHNKVAIPSLYVTTGNEGSIVCGGFDNLAGIFTTAIVYLSNVTRARKKAVLGVNSDPISVKHYFSDVEVVEVVEGEDGKPKEVVKHYNCDISHNMGKFWYSKDKEGNAVPCGGFLRYGVALDGSTYITDDAGNYHNRPLVPGDNGKGYLRIRLQHKNRTGILRDTGVPVHGRIGSGATMLHHLVYAISMKYTQAEFFERCLRRGDFVIDHIDSNPLNNSRENLDIVTDSMNKSVAELRAVFGLTGDKKYRDAGWQEYAETFRAKF